MLSTYRKMEEFVERLCHFLLPIDIILTFFINSVCLDLLIYDNLILIG